MEQTNARSLTPSSFGTDWTPVDLVVADCSFISLRRILPAAATLVRPGGSIVALIKPQFEAGKSDVDAGEGVISDPAIHARVISELETFVREELNPLRWEGTVESPLLGPAGNKEFLVRLYHPTS
jgi:23S rRNA (cytidine1920-2'-O)/16S rRNA (cytidine1409-2'-O)-methyltransferase